MPRPINTSGHGKSTPSLRQNSKIPCQVKKGQNKDPKEVPDTKIPRSNPQLLEKQEIIQQQNSEREITTEIHQPSCGCHECVLQELRSVL